MSEDEVVVPESIKGLGLRSEMTWKEAHLISLKTWRVRRIYKNDPAQGITQIFFEEYNENVPPKELRRWSTIILNLHEAYQSYFSLEEGKSLKFKLVDRDLSPGSTTSWETDYLIPELPRFSIEEL